MSAQNTVVRVCVLACVCAYICVVLWVSIFVFCFCFYFWRILARENQPNNATPLIAIFSVIVDNAMPCHALPCLTLPCHAMPWCAHEHSTTHAYSYIPCVYILTYSISQMKICYNVLNSHAHTQAYLYVRVHLARLLTICPLLLLSI